MPIVDLALDASKAKLGAKDFDAAANEVGRSVDKIKRGTDEASSGFDRLRGSINNAGPVIIAAVASAGLAVSGFIIKSTKLASDLEETQNKFDVVFAGMRDKAELWARDLQQNYIMTTEEAKRFLAGTQDLLVPMGVAKDKAGELSYEFVKLATDLGSFENMKTEDVINAMQSALVGNYETMKQFGVVINSNLVEQKAYQMGLVKTGEDLDASAKAQAGFQLMLEGTTAAIGDTERSRDSFANQYKQMTANITELTTIIGQLFLPVATEIVTAMSNWLQTQENLNNVVNIAVESVRFLYNGFQGLVLIAKGVIVAVGYLAEAFTRGFRAMLFPVDALMKALQEIGMIQNNPLDAMTQGVEDFKNSALEGFETSWKKVQEGNKYFDNMKIKLGETASSVAKLTEAQKEAAAGTEGHTDAMMKQVPVYDFVKNAAGEYVQVLKGFRTPLAQAKTETDGLKTAAQKLAEEKKKNVEAANLVSTAHATVAKDFQNTARAADAATSSVDELSSSMDNQQLIAEALAGSGESSYKKVPATGSVNIPSILGISTEEWQALNQATKDRMYDATMNRTVDSDYFNSSFGRSRFRGGTDLETSLRRILEQSQFETQMAETHQTAVTNVFNQSVSRSDVISIVEEMNRSFARA